MIIREHYLKKIRLYLDKPFIKVLTGLRRVGKSVLLDQIIDDLIARGVDRSSILKLNFELPAHFDITDAATLTKVVLDWAQDKPSPLYLFLDEVGRIPQWEKAINGFHSMGRFDITITGSNADLLSSDLATYLAGRTIEILIHPFSYREFLLLYPKASFNDYVIFGGIPSIAGFNLDYEPSMTALRDSFKSAVLQDVISRHQIRNPIILDRLIRYVFANTSKTFSALSIANYLKSQRITVSVDTILHYLKLLNDAFLIDKVMREDVLGKTILKTEEKYYIADHGYREAIIGNNQAAIEMVLENIVYTELIRRGYQVTIGKANQNEIDFVARKEKEKVYIQVCYLLAMESTRQREFGAFDQLKDHYPRLVLSMDEIDFSQNGIRHQSIIRFLTDNE